MQGAWIIFETRLGVNLSLGSKGPAFPANIGDWIGHFFSVPNEKADKAKLTMMEEPMKKEEEEGDELE